MSGMWVVMTVVLLLAALAAAAARWGADTRDPDYSLGPLVGARPRDAVTPVPSEE